MDLIDIGANLAHESFADDLADVLARAAAVGVHRCVVTGSDDHSNRAALHMARQYPGQCFATAGLHPHQASTWHEDIARFIDTAAADDALVAVGETGLDYFRDISPRPQQIRAFEAQLELATSHGLPVFLHQRDAHEDFIAIVRRHRAALCRMVVHCFTDSPAALEDYLAEDAYIGITGWICDERRGQALFDCVHRIPDDRLMIETDSPYLLPRTIRPRPRTRRNEPAYLPHVLDSLARARGQSIEHVAAITASNAERFFGLSAHG